MTKRGVLSHGMDHRWLGGPWAGPWPSRALLLCLLGMSASALAFGASPGLAQNLPRLGDKKSRFAKTAASASNRSLTRGESQGNPFEDGFHSNAEAENWTSASDSSTSSPASEITKGVRVEDIVEPPADYQYASFGKPDPFVPPLMPQSPAAAKAAGPSTLEIPIVSALQRFPIENLMIVGIWQHSNGDRKALILTPSGGTQGGQGVIVKAGDPIGNRGGKILAIGNDFIAVREFFLAPDGVRQYEDRRMVMTIKPPEQRPAHLLFKPGESSPKEVASDGDHNVEAAALPAGTSSDVGSANGALSNVSPTSRAVTSPSPAALPREAGVNDVGGYDGLSSLPISPMSPVSATSPQGSKVSPSPEALPSGGSAQNGALPGESQPGGSSLINGIPREYVGGAVRASGGDITQPASTNVPPL